MKPLPSLVLVVFLVAVAGGQEIPLMEYVTTAHQAGPDGYRDPRGAISPDGPDIAQELGLRWIAHISQDSRGTFQIFRVPVDGGQSEQQSHDLSNKTHPAYSPDGRHLAFTVWTYDAQFWMIRP